MAADKIYRYPAVFTHEKNRLRISFPDFENTEIICDNPFYLSGNELGMSIALLLDNGEKLPEPSDPTDIEYDEDTQEIQMVYISEKEIKKRFKIKRLI